MTSRVDVHLGDAGGLDLSHQTQGLQRLTLLGVMLERSTTAAMKSRMIRDVGRSEVQVDIFSEGCHAEAVL